MLKALELTGFKSFADKTRFEFPAGITVVVGPNGSGKSNIVDAIKWVLGEQSAKSLRGKEMADVIFKGAGGPNGRRAANSATATIVLDNTDRRFSHDSDEVLVSRRVYRSGEAEYLINNETCRLRDIRDMFRGTGIGTDAYSLIEQGKVERLLQASAKDRRAIFEEAAGISRFKAKKVEALRRLARVEGNLIRLSDIVEEVGSRYRSIQKQATKAAKYKEYSERLQELRTFVGYKDWRSISEKLGSITSAKEESEAKIKELKASISELETDADAVEQKLEKFGTEVAAKQQTASQNRESIAEQKARSELNRTRLEDLETRKADLESRGQRLQSRYEEVSTRNSRHGEDVAQAEQAFEASRSKSEQFGTRLTTIDENLNKLVQENETARGDSGQLLTLINELGRLVSAADSQIESLNGRKSQSEALVSELESTLNERRTALKGFEEAKLELKRDAESKDSAISEARQEFEETKQHRSQSEKELLELRSQLTEKTQRRKVLLELEKRLEGVNAGAKQLLEQAKGASTGPFREIIGVVADMISVNVQHAGIVDVALGNAAQYIVVDGNELIDEIAKEKLKVKGRVGIIQFNDPPTLGADPNANVNGEPGVIGRADRLVQVKSEYANFVRQLLGGTWIVRTLADAVDLNERNSGGIRLVTLDGEIVEADGSVIVGPKAVATGLVSRRSELRMLNREIEELTKKNTESTEAAKEIRKKEKLCESRVQELLGENSHLTQQLADISVRSEEITKQATELDQKLKVAREEYSSNDNSLLAIASQLTGNRQNLTQHESRLDELNQIVIANDSQTSKLRSDRQQAEQELTDAKIELAKCEQSLDTIKQQQEQVSTETDQLAEELKQNQGQIEADEQARLTAKQELEQATAGLEKLESELAAVASELEKVTEQKSGLDEQRREVAQKLSEQRGELREIEDELHKAELKVSHLQMERTKLVERLQEDYGIDIADLDADPEDASEVAQREAIDTEISDLRRKIGVIGSVNMDALAELEDLESRYTKMDEQYQDLVAAKQSLENIIQRINTDSRRLFVETLDAIRSNFQTLFRQTFGGGQADIILEEGVDPLEAGVEIVATPPGKPQFNNSLLSGGEKALTAVSLLMAIFQFRPSPFCVLDEVDAPFDEANIGRFVDVLKSFLGWTKFVIVTHSKKTMTAATTLYGVTMQESGVSKRVSVRFEDVGEDGEISNSAMQRGDNERGVA